GRSRRAIALAVWVWELRRCQCGWGGDQPHGRPPALAIREPALPTLGAVRGRGQTPCQPSSPPRRDAPTPAPPPHPHPPSTPSRPGWVPAPVSGGGAAVVAPVVLRLSCGAAGSPPPAGEEAPPPAPPRHCRRPRKTAQ